MSLARKNSVASNELPGTLWLMTMPKLSADRPGETPEADDAYGRAPFSRHLADLLQATAGAEPPVIGVVGEWGAGKTTVLKFAEHYLALLTPDTEVVWFNPWAYASSGHGAIQEALLQQVSSKVLGRLRQGTQKVKKLAKDYGAGALQAAKLIPFAGDAAAEVGATALARLPDSRKALIAALKERGRPLVVFIDDVDRLTGRELLELFAALRVVVDLPYVQYVLAYDASSVARSLEAGSPGTDGHAFLEKIVAIPVPVPRVPFELLFRKLQRDLRETLVQAGMDTSILSGTMVLDLVEVTRPMLTTPRDLVRFTNRVKTMVSLAVQAELATVDFIMCELLAVFTPGFSDVLGGNKSAALGINLPLADMIGSDRSTKPTDAAKSLFEPALADVAPEHRSGVLRALETSLPFLHSAVTGKKHYGGSAGPRQVAHPAYFDRYFSYSAWAADVPDAEVAARWQRFLSGDAFDAVFQDLIEGDARFVLHSKIIKVMDAAPPTSADVRRLIREIEQLTDTDSWMEQVATASFFDRPAAVDLEWIAAHAVRLTTEADDDLAVIESFEETKAAHFAYYLAIALSAEFELRDDDLKSFHTRLAPHVSSLLGRAGALERFRAWPTMLSDPARYALFYAPSFDAAAWTSAIEEDPTLLEVVLAVTDNVSPDGRSDTASADYIARFVDLDAARDSAAKTQPMTPRVGRYLQVLEGAIESDATDES